MSIQSDYEDLDRPTRVRLGVLGFLCAMSFVLYLDRVCFGMAVVPIQKEFGLNDTEMGVILAAFTVAYGLFEVPAGWLGDRYGARRTLTRIVVWWSAFTFLTAFGVGFVSLVVIRFLFGAGEAGAYPNAARVIRRWFPLGERGRVQGLMMAAALVGGAVSPMATGYLIEWFTWRAAFVAYGAVGVGWAVAFWLWFRDDPAASPGVNAAELAILRADAEAGEPPGPTPWAEALGHRTLWLLGAIVTCAAFTTYFYYSWFPKYLQAARDVSPESAGWLTSAVLIAQAVGLLTGGFLADWAARRADVVGTRRRVSALTMVGAAGLLAAVPFVDSPPAAVAVAAGSCFLMMCQNPIWWACAAEVGGRHIGALFGLMNSMGVVGAVGSQLFFGAFAHWRQAAGHTGRDVWDPAFVVPVALLLVGAGLWWCVRPYRPVGDPEAKV